MTSIAAGLILGFLLATAYGAGFHLFLGGPARRIAVFLAAAWIGFAVGQITGDLLQINLLKLGAVHLLAASVGSWTAIILSWWLSRDDPQLSEPQAERE
jgi:hypothetical protein